MFVVTFYSYKGGVGRTSALVNVAYRLARRGKRVFVLDFDLEAPGIDSCGLSETQSNAPGLVEYISAFTATGKVPSLRDFVTDSSLPETAGKLFLMRGGKKDNTYKSALGQLDWKILYRQRKGFFLVENLKAAIDQLFAPDYLLVDARTGLTDISGICTLQLPHLVVLLFSLNEQNVSGITNVLRSIKGNSLNREIRTLLVASPVPDMPEWVEARSTRFESARRTMGRPVDVVIPYDPFLAFGESIVDGKSRGQSKSQIATAYDALTEGIIAANGSDVLTLLARAASFRNEGQYELAESHYRGVVDLAPQSAEAWVEFGKFEKLRQRFNQACEYFEKAYLIEPTDCEVLAQLASTYAYVDASRCERYYRELVQLDRDPRRINRVSSALENVGFAALAEEGRLKSSVLDDKSANSFTELGQVQMRLHHYRQAAEAYGRGLQLDPNNLVCAFNLGSAYERLHDSRAEEYYSRAINIFEQQEPPQEKIYRANVYEAMSRAYLALGRFEKAVQLLESAIALANEHPDATLFSSTTYELVPKDRFVSDAMERLEAAKRRL